MQKSNAEIYIEKFKELESVVRNTYNIPNDKSFSNYLKNLNRYSDDRDEISYCQEIRNLIQHKKKFGESYPIEPTEETINFISSLIEKVKNKKRCCDICIRFSDIYKKELVDKVKEAMSVMKQKSYTCVPIMNGKKVIGVFDENSLFEYIAKDEIVGIDDNLTFKDIEPYLSITEREMQEFKFFKSQSLVEDLEVEFEKSFRNGKRLSVVFLTPNGKSSEDISGLITAWDVLGKLD